jgi:hypothetical protein
MKNWKQLRFTRNGKYAKLLNIGAHREQIG